MKRGVEIIVGKEDSFKSDRLLNQEDQETSSSETASLKLEQVRLMLLRFILCYVRWNLVSVC